MHSRVSKNQAKALNLANPFLQDFGRSLLLIADLGSLQASIAARFIELFGCERVILFYFEANRGVFTPHFSSGVSLSELSSFLLRRRGPLAKWLLVNEMCLVIPKAPGVYEYLSESEREILASLGILVCIPLICLNRLTGILMLGSSDPKWKIRDEDVNLIQSLAAQAALALENATLYKQQRDRLRRMYRAENLAAVGQLAAGVAHEVRNPLTSIRSTIQYVLKDYSASNPKTVLLEELLREVDRIDGTVNGLLALTRTGEIDPQPLNVVKQLEHSLVLIRPQAQAKGILLQLETAAEDIRIMGVANELTQVFLNILLNALHAVSRGGIIRCECEKWQEPAPTSGHWAQITISDSGIGIPPEHLEKIFDPFFTTKREGTGLGLAVCHGIVQRHEGEIDIRSTVEKGTSVIIRLPLL